MYMDSGSSGSLQSSSGGGGGGSGAGAGAGGDEEYNSRVAAAAEFIPTTLLTNPSHFFHISNQEPSQTLPPPPLAFFEPTPSNYPHTNFSSSSFLSPQSSQPQPQPQSQLIASANNPATNYSLLSNHQDTFYPRSVLRQNPASNQLAHSLIPSPPPPSSSTQLSSSNSLMGHFPNTSSASLSLPLHPGRAEPSAPSDQTLPSAGAAAAAAGGGRSSSKKRTRASRRAPTTVLTTDTSNFRAMVQEFTGIPAPPFSATSPSLFKARRLDLFATAGSSMRPGGGHSSDPLLLPPLGPGYPLRPSVQKFNHQPVGSPPPPSSSILRSPPSSSAIINTSNNFIVQSIAKSSSGAGGANPLMINCQNMQNNPNPSPQIPKFSPSLADHVPFPNAKGQGMSAPVELGQHKYNAELVMGGGLPNHEANAERSLLQLIRGDYSSNDDNIGLITGWRDGSASDGQDRFRGINNGGGVGDSKLNASSASASSFLVLNGEKTGSENVLGSRSEGNVLDSWICNRSN